MSWIHSLFGAPQVLIGMLHVGPLPGAPGWSGDLGAIVDRAVEEATVYQQAGYGALILENMHDRPYLKGEQVGPETVAALAVLGLEIRRAVHIPLGLQVLAGANRQALAIALACQADFIRAEGFVFGHVADEGWIDAQAGDLLRYRERIGANSVKIIADIKKKHSAHAATADVSLVETARAAEFFLADGVVVTGAATAEPAQENEVEEVSVSVKIPTFVGSGLTPHNLARYRKAHGFIVGSSVKQDGRWDYPLDAQRVADIARAFAEMTKGN